VAGASSEQEVGGSGAESGSGNSGRSQGNHESECRRTCPVPIAEGEPGIYVGVGFSGLVLNFIFFHWEQYYWWQLCMGILFPWLHVCSCIVYDKSESILG